MRIMSTSDSRRKLFRLINNMHMICTHFNHTVQYSIIKCTELLNDELKCNAHYL